MNFLSKFTVTPLLYACGALLLVIAGMGVALKLKAGDVTTAEAKQAAAESDLRARTTERDAWKRRVDELAAANGAYAGALEGMRNELATCQGENKRVSEEGQRAVAAAQADARDADRTLQLFTAKFQTESRKPTCARALEAMGAACPALEGY